MLHQKIVDGCLRAGEGSYSPTVLVMNPEEENKAGGSHLIGGLDSGGVINYLQGVNQPGKILYLADSRFIFHEPETLVQINDFWQGLIVWRPPQIHRLMTVQEKLGPELPKIFGMIDYFISQSDEMTEMLTLMGVAREIIEQIDNRVDMRVFHPYPNEREKREARKGIFPGLGDEAMVCVYSGRIYQPKKRVVDLIKSWTMSGLGGEGNLLLLVGPNQEGIPGLDSVEELQSQNVLMTGAVSQLKVAEYLRLADVYVLPTIPEGEGFSNSLLEAAASGCVPVSRRGVSGSGRLIIPGETGFFFEDVQSLSQLLLMLKDNQVRQPVIKRMLARVRQSFTQEVMAEHHLDFYRMIMENKLQGLNQP